jgi:hypothetical protein
MPALGLFPAHRGKGCTAGRLPTSAAPHPGRMSPATCSATQSADPTPAQQQQDRKQVKLPERGFFAEANTKGDSLWRDFVTTKCSSGTTSPPFPLSPVPLPHSSGPAFAGPTPAREAAKVNCVVQTMSTPPHVLHSPAQTCPTLSALCSAPSLIATASAKLSTITLTP